MNRQRLIPLLDRPFPKNSGVEVVALVAGLVSAFRAAKSLYCEWREKRRERREKEENNELNSLLKHSGPQTQEEYDQDFRQLGRVFAQGDSM